MTEARGIRNNNPGNIRWGEPWQGLVPEDQRTDKSFCQFISPKYGIRALAKILITYQDKYELNTVRKIIHRWAPPNENDTDAYVRAVSGDMGMGPDASLDVHHGPTMRGLVCGIIRHENGHQPYDAATVGRGLILAGVNL